MNTVVAIQKRTFFPHGSGIDTMHYRRYHGFERNGRIWQNIGITEFATMLNLDFIVDDVLVSEFRKIPGAKTIELFGCEFFSSELLVGDFSHWDILKENGSDERMERLLMKSRVTSTRRRFRIEFPSFSDAAGILYEAAVDPTEYDPVVAIELNDQTIDKYPVIQNGDVYYVRKDYFSYLSQCFHPNFFLVAECTRKQNEK